ncbi:hypothetical protein IFM12275_24030 [Nocardia sputorum]|nr:hypothetical protein IFM12275_24030 [Nocardia sputorum]
MTQQWISDSDARPGRVRLRTPESTHDGVHLWTDGPFIETKEHAIAPGQSLRGWACAESADTVDGTAPSLVDS